MNFPTRGRVGKNPLGLGSTILDHLPKQGHSRFAGSRSFLCAPKRDFRQVAENEQQIKIQF